MDESQHAIEKKDFKFKMFKFEEGNKEDEKRAESECKSFKSEEEARTGKRWSDVNHTNTCFYVAYSRAGEITSRALELAGEHFNMNASITGGYQCGTDWASCH